MTENLTQILEELRNINSSLSNNFEWITTSISTLAGVFVGGYVTHFYQNKGSLKIFINKTNFTFRKSFNNGFEHRNVKINESPEFGQLFIDIDFMNPKPISENIRQFKLVIETKTKEKELELYNRDSHRISAGRSEYDEIVILNMAPSQFRVIN